VNTPGTALAASAAPDTMARQDHRRRVTAWARAHAALILLLLVPFAAFGLPVLLGNALLDGDNWIQNFPLRVLVARDLDHGMLPLWNPYLFSGTPLLAGFNAGAAYPGTWLMAVLPVFAAWALTFAAVYDLALLGMYLFFRRQGMCSAAAAFGAATFAFAGYLTAQIVHVDLIQGAASLPWMLLAVHAMTERPEGAAAEGAWRGIVRVRGYVALLAVAFGLSILSGGVEAIIDGAVLLLIYWVGRLVALGYLRRGGLRSLVAPVATFLLGLSAGAALGGAQLIPGGAFVAHSQRSGSSYAFFTTGSLPGRLITLLISPFVIGTNQNEPAFYAGPYNFPEVTSYVGILALIAACVLLTRRWRKRPQSRHWDVWYVVMAVGLLSALGNQTFFARFLYLVPGLNSQRLLNRNLLLVDCSLAVLLAWWSHLLLTERDPAPPRSKPIRSRWRPGHRAELAATCAPFALSALLCLSLWVAGPLLDRFLETSFPVDEATRLKLAPLVTAGTLIAGAATWIVLAEARFSTTALRRLLAGVLAADLALFNLFMIRPPIGQAQAQAQGPAAAAFQSTVGDGRFIIFDPDRFYGDQLLALGQTDLNIFNRLPSAQGYTALTDARYYQATGAHLQEDLDPATLAGPVWDDLNVTTLLSVPSYFVTPAPSSPATAATGFPFPTDVLTGQSMPGADGPFTVTSNTVRRWYFGGVLTVQSWTVPIEAGSGGDLSVGLLTTTGHLQWLPPADVRRSVHAQQRTVEVSLPSPVAAGGVVIRAGPSGPLAVGAPTARTAEAGPVRLDGRMQPGVTDPHWAFTGALGPFGVFHNTDARGWAWLKSPSGGPAAAGNAVSAAAPGPGGGQDITVHATSAVTLDRSESWAAGWQATVGVLSAAAPGRPVGPPEHTVVTRDGLVQRVDIPGPGDYRVTFTYTPTPARVGILVSAVAAGALGAWGVAESLGRWRRRRRNGRAAPGEGSRTQSGMRRPMDAAARR
jgi:hypothetical protein